MKKSLALILFLILFFSDLLIFLSKFPQEKQTYGQTNGINLEVSSSYYGRVAGGPREEDYAPSIMLDNGGYKMWWCHYHHGKEYKDHIWYATSIDGFNWSEPISVLEHGNSGGQEGYNTCDPSVIKVGDVYYMYYTSDSPSRIGRDNQIFLATSYDGIHWSKYPSDENPQPVIPCENPDGSYCVGQSSLLYLNNQFIHYFTEQTTEETGRRDKIYLATSTDGINFNRENNGQPIIYDQAGVDVKYTPNLGVYFAVYGGGSWIASTDGINWPAHDPNKFIETQKEFNHNFGLLGSPIGTIEDETIAYYGAGTRDPGSWDIDATIINLSSSLKDCDEPCASTAECQGDYVCHPAGIFAGYRCRHKDCLSQRNCLCGDFNEDGQVDTQDVKILLQNWGDSFLIFEADLNYDNMVNGVDFGIILRLL